MDDPCVRHPAMPLRRDSTLDEDRGRTPDSEAARRSSRREAARQARSGGRGPAPVTATLDAAPTGQAAVVQSVNAPPGAPEWATWLEEIGFIPGERVMVMARGLPGGNPLVVRVGNSTFALRRAEAACIQIGSAPP